MYSAYKLNKQSDSIQPWHTLSQFETSSLFHVWFWLLLLDLHTGFTGDWWGGLVFTTLSEFSTVCVTHIAKGFSVVSEAEVDVFLQFSCFFCDPMDVGNVISGSPVFSNPAYTCRNSYFTYCWNLAWRILRITLLACEMSAIVLWLEHSLALPFFGIWMKTNLFQSCGHCWVFQLCWHIKWST